MKKAILISSIASLLISNSFAENSISDMFKNGEVNGHLRAGYVNYSFDAIDETAFGVGGKLHYNTDPSQMVTLGATFYTTHTLGLTDSNPAEVAGDFFSSSKDSYSILGEAYAQFNLPDTVIKIGRQELDTPLAETDDFSIIPNTFEAFVAINNSLPDTTLIGAYVTKMSGWDSEGKAEKFVNVIQAAGVNGDKGIATLAAVYEGIPNLNVQLWDYYVTDVLNAIYAEASYEIALSGLTVGFGAQYQTQSEVGDELAGEVDSNMYGLLASVGIDSTGTSLTLAYNDGNENDLVEAWGGGPMYVSFEELGSVGNGGDSKAFMVGLDQDFSSFGVEGFSAGLYYGTMEAANNFEESEFDLLLAYEKDNLALEGVAAFITDDNDKTAEYDKYFVRATYSF